MVDVRDAAAAGDVQPQYAAVAEHCAVLEIEAAARSVGDAAVAACIDVVEQRAVAQIDRRVAGLQEAAALRQRAAAIDRATGPAQVAGHLGGVGAADGQRTAAQFEIGCDRRAVAQHQRAAADGQYAIAIDGEAAGGGRAPGAHQHACAVGDGHAAAERDRRATELHRAGTHREAAVLVKGERAVAAEIHAACTALDQGSGVLEATAAAGVVIDVHDAAGTGGIQREHAGIAENGTVLDVEAAARRVGNAAVAGGVGVQHLQAVAQIDRGVAALDECAIQRQRTRGGQIGRPHGAAVPDEVVVHRCRAGQ